MYTNCSSTNPNTALALNDASTLLVLRYYASAASGPLIEAPSAKDLRNLGSAFAFDYLTLPGVPYVVETSPDLMKWTAVNGANGQTATSLQSSYYDSNPGSGTRKSSTVLRRGNEHCVASTSSIRCISAPVRES